MNNSKVAIRYASSLLDLALEKKSEDTVSKDMELVFNTIKGSEDLLNVLKSPVVKAEKKSTILAEVFKGKINDTSASFLELIVQKKREDILDQITSAYNESYKTHKGITTALVTSATKLDDKAKEKIAGLLNVEAKKLEITEKIDPSIIGGFIVKVGDKQIDTTVKSKLLNIQHEFSANVYESKS